MKKPFWAGGFLYNPKTKSVLLHHRDANTEFNPNKWAFFGGLAEGDETPEQCFIREIKEELNINVSPNELIPICDYLNVAFNTYRYVFCVESERAKEQMALGEGADFDWIPFDRINRYNLTEHTKNDLIHFNSMRNIL